MNDPGLDEPIADHADDVENQERDDDKAEEEEESQYLDSTYVLFTLDMGCLFCGSVVAT